MKKNILFYLLFIISLNAFSQVKVSDKALTDEYYPFLNNSSWNYDVYYFGGSENVTITPDIDISIGSLTYKKFIDPFFGETLIREDVSAKKVYRSINNSDVLIFDFSLQVSNTITLSNGDTYSVASITNVNVNGGQRRKFYLTNLTNDNGFNEIWIEGVGNPDHPLRGRYAYPSNPVYYLKCSFQNGVNVYNKGLASGGSASDCTYLNIENQNHLDQAINFSPNPFKSEISITSEIEFKNATIKIFNSIGQLVKEIDRLSGQHIILKRDDLKSGIYFSELLQNGKLISSNKLIISD